MHIAQLALKDEGESRCQCFSAEAAASPPRSSALYSLRGVVCGVGACAQSVRSRKRALDLCAVRISCTPLASQASQLERGGLAFEGVPIPVPAYS